MAADNFDRHKERMRYLEDSLTPSEIAKLIQDRSHEEFPFAIRPLLQNGQAPSGYVRERWCENANYYTANHGARSLIVAFCGLVNRVGVPTSYFLQMLRDDLYDVIILSDPRLLHFDHGVPGFSNSFVETIRRVEDFAAAKGFEEVITFGASMGGFAALRAGLLLNARRAISIGGRYCWHVSRLMSNEEEINAFDVLCSCYSKSKVQMVAVVAAKNQEDVENLEVMRRTFPACHAVMIDTNMHNVTGYFYKLGLLRLFYACLFEYGGRPASGSELLPLLSEIARHADAYASQRTEQILKLRQDGAEARKRLDLVRQQSAARLQKLELARQKSAARLQQLKAVRQKSAARLQRLKAVYASRSWRLTKPLRMLSRLLSRR